MRNMHEHETARGLMHHWKTGNFAAKRMIAQMMRVSEAAARMLAQDSMTEAERTALRAMWEKYCDLSSAFVAVRDAERWSRLPSGMWSGSTSP